jgi:23S rRNA (guanine745-N1)-methyltransferase
MAKKPISFSTPMICPVCKNELLLYKDSNTYRCTKGHSYDIAKQAYTNLLISNQKKSLTPGDGKDMMKVRRDFLNQGFYRPISDSLNTLVAELLTSSSANILDLGCGEGYYLHRLKLFIDENKAIRNRKSYYGLDISKEALKLAGNRKINVTWIVASSFHTPFRKQSMDFILSVFSPISDDELKRILSKEGYFIRILPNANHLIELREMIYDTLEERREGTILPKYLDCISETKVSYSIELTQDNIPLLLQMTPHYWKTSAQKQEKLYTLDSMTITIDMNIGVFKCKD